MGTELHLSADAGERLISDLHELDFRPIRWRSGEESVPLLFVPAEARKTLQRVRSARQAAPESALVVLGPSEEPSEVVACARAGASDWLTPPFERERLRGILAEVEMRQRLSADQRSLLSDLTQKGEEREHERRELRRQLAAMAEQLERSNRELADAHVALQQRVAQLGTLYRIGRELSVQRNWDEALQSLLGQLRDVISARGAALLLYSRRGERLAVRSSLGMEDRALREASTLLLTRSQELERDAELFSLAALREGGEQLCDLRTEAWSLTVMPLRHRDLPLGHLLLDKDYDSAALFEQDRFFLRSFQAILAEEVATAQAMNELRRLQEFHRRMLDHVGSAVFTLDSTGAIRFANRSARELMDEDPEQRNVDSFLRMGSERIAATRWCADLQSGERRIGDGWLRRGDQSEIPVGLSAASLPEEFGAQRPILLVAEDMRHRRALEAERRRVAHQDELLIMAAEWAHDVRTPLTGILHGAELLAEDIDEGHSRRRHFELIRSEVQRLDQLVANFLDFARPAQLKSERAELLPLLRDSVGLLQALARERGLSLRTDLEMDSAVLRMDRDALKQVLLNLLTNAVDASPSGGEVLLRLRHSDEEIDDARLSRAAGAVAVEVVDSGSGVAAKNVDRLFIPFFTTKQNGTGLGLAICEKIARAHHGHLRYERRDAHTIFRLTLPLAQSEPAAPVGDGAGG